MQPEELGQRAGILAITKARGGAELLLLGVLVYKINELISFYGSTLLLLLLFQRREQSAAMCNVLRGGVGSLLLRRLGYF